MKQIFKNYLATFIKNWLQTIGTILFILMMAAIVIGFLAAPLQIYSHIQSMNGKNNHYNQIASDDYFKFNSRFLYKTIYNNDDYYAAKSASDDSDDTSKKIMSKLPGDEKFLSDIYYAAVQNEIGTQTFKTNHDMYDAYASYIRNGVNSFRQGALVKTNVSFDLGWNDKLDTSIKTLDGNEHDLTSDFIKNINNIIYSDNEASAAKAADPSQVSRAFAKINFIFSSNSFGYTSTDLARYMTSTAQFDPVSWSVINPKVKYKNSTLFGEAIVDLMRAELWKNDFQSQGGRVSDLPTVDANGAKDDTIWNSSSNKDANLKAKDTLNNEKENSEYSHRPVYLISSQVFNDQPYNDYSNFYNKITGLANRNMTEQDDWGHAIQYSSDLLNYVSQAITMDPTNYMNSQNDGKNAYNPFYEKTMYLSETSSSSLFPTLGIDLYTVNGANDPNQLQLREGNRPTPLVWHSLEEKYELIQNIINGTIVPEIVINSGYASNNHLHVGDMITLPDGPEHNNVSTLVGNGSGDDFLTSKVQYRISGIGEKFDNSTPGKNYTPFMEDIKSYANGYVDDGYFTLLREAKWNNTSVASKNFNSLVRFTNEAKTKTAPVYMFAPNNDKETFNDGVFDNSNSPFTNYSDTSTMKSLNDLKIRVIIFIILGVAVLALAFIFINFIITKELNETRRQIGIFKSFGYNIGELSWIFAVKTFLTIFVGMILGFIISIPLQLYSAGNYTSSVMFKFDKIFAGGGFLPIIFLVIPAVFLILSYLMTLFYLAEPTLSLLSNGSKVKKGKVHTGPLIKYLSLRGKGFGYRLQQAFVKNSKGKFVVIQILFAIASLVFTLMFGAQTLMYSVANQGFSVLQKNADHRFVWQNQDKIDIGYGSGDGKYEMDPANNVNFDYKAYSGKELIGDVLNNDSDMSDSRYRENFLITSITNTFDVSKDQALEMLMPLDYFLVKDAGVKQADLPAVVDTIINKNNPNYNFFHNAALADAKIPDAMKDQEMGYHNYYLNWILSFRIALMKNQDTDKVAGIDTIKKELIAGDNNKFNLSNLISYVDNWNAAYDNEKDGPIKIDMNSIVSNPDSVRTQFKDTLFGLSDTTNGKKNNLFLADITKIITLELAESYAEGKYSVALGNDKNQSSVVDALNKAKQDSVMQSFSPNNKKYWGLQNNPLMDISSMMSNGSSASSTSSDASTNGGGLSLSKMNAQTISLVMAAAMLGYNSPNIQDMPVATVNTAFFNKDTEALFYNIAVTGVDDSQHGRNSVTLFKYDDSYGKYDSSLTHDGVSDQTFKDLAKDSSIDGTINAVVPYGLAKYRNLHVGDVFTVYSDTKKKTPIKLHITGINKSVAMSLGGGWSIDADYNQFAKHYFGDDLQKEVNKHPLFNSWISNEPMLQGDINLNDIPSSINTMKYVGKNLAISIKPGTSIFGSIFNGMVDFSTLLGSSIDPDYRLITNPNVASTSNLSSVLPFNILRAGVNQGIDEIDNILILFMCLVAILLLIILVLVMNIIVEQATPIILTLKSLGYRQREINWITMGSYIIGAVVSFVIAYGISLLIWNVFLIVAANLWHIYVFMAYSWKAPVITFLVIGVILFIGWFVSDRKVEKIPLTLVTGFN